MLYSDINFNQTKYLLIQIFIPYLSIFELMKIKIL